MIHLRERLTAGDPVVCPGVFDALSALLAERAGCGALFLSGSALSYSALGRPDIGLITASELVDTAARVAERVEIPVLVDADGGLGGPAHVERLVRQLDRVGAAAVQIEDQVEVKPGSALTSRPLVPVETMVGKIKAAQDARLRDDFLISARTDAAVSVDFDEALRRAERYLETGCDLLFIEGITSEAQLAEVGRRFGNRVPLVHNMFKGGTSPSDGLALLAQHNFALALFSGAVIGTMMHAAQAMLARLLAAGSLSTVDDVMMANADIIGTIGGPEFLARFADKA